MQNNYRVIFKKGCPIESIDVLFLSEDFFTCVTSISNELIRFLSLDNDRKARSLYIAKDEISVIVPI
jgi:hypothetical protein